MVPIRFEIPWGMKLNVVEYTVSSLGIEQSKSLNIKVELRFHVNMYV